MRNIQRHKVKQFVIFSRLKIFLKLPNRQKENQTEALELDVHMLINEVFSSTILLQRILQIMTKKS